MRRLIRTALTVLVGAVALATASTAAALPANPWTGQWLNNNYELITLTQTGSQITGTQLCPNTTSLPGITLTGTASADNTVPASATDRPERTKAPQFAGLSTRWSIADSNR